MVETNKEIELSNPSNSNDDSMKTVLTIMSDYFLIVNIDGKIKEIKINDNSILGIQEDMIIGKSIDEIFPTSISEMSTQLLSSTTNSGSATQSHLQFSQTNSIYDFRIKSININPDEYVILIDHLDTTSLRAELDKIQKHYNYLFQNMIAGFAFHKIILDENDNPSDYEFIDINEAFTQQVGLDRDIIGKRVTEIIPGIENDQTDWIGIYGNIAINQESVYFESYSEPLNKSFLIHAYSPEQYYFTTVFIDITDLKEAERTLQESHDNLEKIVGQRTSEIQKYSKQLEISNKDLENFAYAASHDLQQPLRMVSSFTKLIEEKLDTTQDSELQEYVEIIIDNVASMESLISNLLTLSRIAKSTKVTVIDCKEVIADISRNLKSTAEHLNFKIRTTELPNIHANRTLIKQLLQNLIENGLKFNKNDPRIVEITSDEREDSWIFHVSDNGVGIDAKYQGKLFNMFYSAHSRKEFSGTGIGLTICQRIVQHHGGEIWLESEPGNGTVFHFTIRKNLTVGG